jgi:hypothetical protein
MTSILNNYNISGYNHALSRKFSSIGEGFADIYELGIIISFTKISHFHMPLYSKDMRLYNGNVPTTFVCGSPFFPNPYKENPFEFKRVDWLSSVQKLKGKEEELILKLQGDIHNLVAMILLLKKIIPDTKPGKT